MSKLYLIVGRKLVFHERDKHTVGDARAARSMEDMNFETNIRGVLVPTEEEGLHYMAREVDRLLQIGGYSSVNVEDFQLKFSCEPVGPFDRASSSVWVLPSAHRSAWLSIPEREELSHEDFERRFLPYMDVENQGSSYLQVEPPWDEDAVKAIEEHRLWTAGDDDHGNFCIQEGNHAVNRLYSIITKIPYYPGTTYFVQNEDDVTEEEEEEG